MLGFLPLKLIYYLTLHLCQGWKKCSLCEWNKQLVAFTDLGQVLAELHVLTLYG